MSVRRLLFRVALGRRLPVTAGELAVPGVAGDVTIRRDKWGVPHIGAGSDADAWFALGFCHAQDRGFQLETSLRVGRGTMAELVGPPGLPVDRMSRRVGFRRSAVAQLPAVEPDVAAAFGAYVAGVNAGFAHGLSAKPHEFAVLGGEPTAWEIADPIAYLKLLSFMLPGNWDVELARLKVLQADGPAAVAALDPSYPVGHPVTATGTPHRAVLDHLSADLALFQSLVPTGGGSNNWVIAGSRTLSKKPLLANDPHLAPTVPPPWYLAHIRTPNWSVCGATFPGCPGFPIGHNGFACWGVTAGLTDNTDLFLETLSADGRSCRGPGGDEPCEVVREVINVKGGPAEEVAVTVTPRGPVISGIVPGTTDAVSLRAVWLDPLPIRGFVDAHHATSFDTFRRPFAAWPVLPLNLVYADASGQTGWQLVGQVPERKAGHGMLPLPADGATVGWAGLVPFEKMPFAANPPDGYLATANNLPAGDGPFLGGDFIDGYRCQVIREELAKSPVGWTVADCLRLQQSVRSKPWEEMRSQVLAVAADDPDAALGLDLLRAWDGRVAADSPAAGVFETFVAEMCCRVAKAKAPRSWQVAVGGAGDAALAHNLFGDRRVAHLAHLIVTQPAGWFAGGWPAELADALRAAVRRLRAEFGPGPRWWQWGDRRPLLVRHPVLGKSRLLGPVVNLGPVPCGGDQNTVSQAGVRPLEVFAPTHNMANLRTAFDPADWANCRAVLCGGQSGNPCSPHYDDQFALWRRGEAIPLPWTADEVLRATVASLRLKAPG